MKFHFLAACLLAAIALSHAYNDGVTSLDYTTFYKIVTPDKHSIVNLDLKNPHGDRTETWRSFAKRVGKMFLEGKIQLLAGEVNCHTEWWYNDDAHFNEFFVRDHFNHTFPKKASAGVEKTYVPGMRLFRRGYFDKPVSYPDKHIDQANIERFVQRQFTDVWFALPGTLPEMERYVVNFLHPSNTSIYDGSVKTVMEARGITDEERMKKEGLPPIIVLNRQLAVGHNNHLDSSLSKSEQNDRRAAILKLAEKVFFTLGNDDKRESATVYTNFMKKIIEQGPEYIIYERHRLMKMIEQDIDARKRSKRGEAVVEPGSKDSRVLLNDEQKAMVERKLNIISTFRSPTAVTGTVPDRMMAHEDEESAKIMARRQKLMKRREIRRPKVTGAHPDEVLGKGRKIGGAESWTPPEDIDYAERSRAAEDDSSAATTGGGSGGDDVGGDPHRDAPSDEL